MSIEQNISLNQSIQHSEEIIDEPGIRPLNEESIVIKPLNQTDHLKEESVICPINNIIDLNKMPWRNSDGEKWHQIKRLN